MTDAEHREHMNKCTMFVFYDDDSPEWGGIGFKGFFDNEKGTAIEQVIGFIQERKNNRGKMFNVDDYTIVQGKPLNLFWEPETGFVISKIAPALEPIPITLGDQIKVAQEEVTTWPDSIKDATNISFETVFPPRVTPEMNAALTNAEKQVERAAVSRRKRERRLGAPDE